MENELPKRKRTRLENFDYNLPGAYFVTVCTENRRNILWNGNFELQKFNWITVGANCVRPQNLPLSETGKNVMEELERWHKTYLGVSLQTYVIMPNHLHIMIEIYADEYGRTQFAPTVSRMIKQFKGTVTKKIGRSIWQKSFHDHVIRNYDDYIEHQKYILENPMKWQFDELYSE